MDSPRSCTLQYKFFSFWLCFLMVIISTFLLALDMSDFGSACGGGLYELSIANLAAFCFLLGLELLLWCGRKSSPDCVACLQSQLL